MSNITEINEQVGIGWEYSTFILGTMFVVSEIMPLLKGKSNGLLQGLLCLIKGSKCLLDNVEEKIENQIGKPKETIDV
tara:strand:+ start:653 stop:886 length:234 start_codon:yes stop_codon:yes gene_type:complete